MKKTVLLFLAFILAFSFFKELDFQQPHHVHAQSVEKGEITANSLNIRSKPTTNSGIIGGYFRGASVELHEKTGSWYKVRYNNQWGYIHSSHVKVTSSSSAGNSSSQAIGSGEVTASSLNVRVSASTSSRVMSRLSRGTKVDLFEQSGDWYKIKAGNSWGYIHSSHVRTAGLSSNRGSSGSSQTSNSPIGTGEVTASNLNVRASATTSSSIISSLRRGAKVDLHEKSGDWYKIKVGSNWGYIHSSYVKASGQSSGTGSSGSSQDTSSATGSGEITASSLNVRASASTSSQTITRLSRGTKIDLFGKTGDWYKIKVGSGWGYIHSSFVRTSGTSSSSDSSSGSSSNSNASLGTGQITATSLNVRESASTDSRIISRLSRGTEVQLHEQSGDFYKIKSGNSWGYIHGSYVRLASQSSGSSGGGSGSLNGKTIFIDPGHGGRDPGAVAGNVYESHIVLAISQKLKAALEREGARVVMSRTNDSFVTIGNRVSQANQSGADLFISVHANSFPSPSVNGSEVLYSETRAPAQSRRLAQEIQASIAGGMNMRDRGVVRRNLQVLTGPTMPAVLIEPGFISNTADLEKLLNQQDKLVNEIVKGINNYYR
ncbi:N-acetylmuramoyl-L-alanine amidase [Salipaludibacillus aurantiacus]|uniref:N-acetylmuramoyl-L-alanine amidase n=1 Tax=Salipaludibacillus aurantiacus TaxID=1601833 RepID=A0A1H9X557_9BACI|nr:N-acetylmuramoyl-L-alanine amidase [Salipaludibacillus aurantiacus]SES41285.1 N-acetylmuramoyl-L-alanine amidase [Salipaludibacillus aurantiacus]